MTHLDTGWDRVLETLMLHVSVEAAAAAVMQAKTSRAVRMSWRGIVRLQALRVYEYEPHVVASSGREEGGVTLRPPLATGA